MNPSLRVRAKTISQVFFPQTFFLSQRFNFTTASVLESQNVPQKSVKTTRYIRKTPLNKSQQPIHTKLYDREQSMNLLEISQVREGERSNERGRERVAEYVRKKLDEKGRVSSTELNICLAKFNIETCAQHFPKEGQFFLVELAAACISRWKNDLNPEEKTKDIYLLLLGLAQFVQSSRDQVSLEFLQPLASTFEPLFAELESAFTSALTSPAPLPFEDLAKLQLHILLSCGKANLLSQPFYSRLLSLSRAPTPPLLEVFSSESPTHLYQADFNVVRLYQAMLRAQEFSEAANCGLRRNIVKRLVTKFASLSAFGLALLLYLQESLGPQCEVRERIDPERIMKRMENRGAELRKLDPKTREKLRTAFKIIEFEEICEKHRLSKMAQIRDELNENYQEMELPEATKSQTQLEIESLITKAFSQAQVIPECHIGGKYQVDLVLRGLGIQDIGLEIQDPVTKYFRAKYPSPGQRIRRKLLEKEGLKMIEINTKMIPNGNTTWENTNEQDKIRALRSYISKQLI